ncbi:MAG: spore gernimation protein GerC, partial [Paenibacillus sp.]|nr:spore gernimation protein GerC [Paenibacillus sp.]
ELTDWGFVQAAAIDQSEKGGIQLTTQVYKPSVAVTQGAKAAKGSTFIDIVSESKTVNGASRDATNELGRKLQWSHMRVLLISEDIAKSKPIGDILDFFSRFNEPRGSIIILITKGPASDFLNISPLIENTIGQQLKSAVELAQVQSGNTLDVTLKDLTIKYMEPFSTFVIPYVSLLKEEEKLPSISGFAIINFPEGKISGMISGVKTPYVLMLMNKYEGGFIDVPCDSSKNGASSHYDSFKISKVHTKIKTSMRNDKLLVQYMVNLEGNMAELICAPVVTKDDIRVFVKRTQEQVEKRLRETIVYSQKQKSDVFGVSTHLHRWQNSVWKTLKNDWRNEFARSQFEIEVKVKMLNSGMNNGKPLVKNGKYNE